MTAKANLPFPRARHDWLALWILFSAWCSFSGWILSWLGCLDRAGYAVSFLLFLGGIVFGRRHFSLRGERPIFLFRKALYTRHWLPKLWLIIVLMVLAGGLLYHADNFDYLTYRFPRVLHWCWRQHWYWITSLNLRQNISSTGFEWMMAPLFVFFQTDRLFFILNLVSYIFLPGLIFSVFRNFGISGRVCWWWMWLLPTGFCYVLQAGGAANDMFAAVYFLAALHYLFKARQEQRCSHLVFSCLSIALLTGAKASNIPLMVPWLALIFLNGKPLWAAFKPGVLIGTGIVAVIISFLPVALINIHFTGGYTGDPRNRGGLQMSSPVAGIIGNSIEIAVTNLSPPVWTHQISWSVAPLGIEGYLQRNFPRFDARTEPFPIEESAGLGLGVTGFAVLSLIFGLWARVARPALTHKIKKGSAWLVAATAVAWLGYMSKIGGEDSSRLVAVYYLLGIGAILAIVPVDGIVVHRRLWKWVGYAAMAMIFPVLLLNPSRPLLPLHLLVDGLRKIGVPASPVAQLEENHRLRAFRFDGFRDLLQSVPATETAIGAIAGSDDPEVSLWLPFGSREVIEVSADRNTPGDLSAMHIHYVVVSAVPLQFSYHMTLDGLLDEWSMTLVQKKDLTFTTQQTTEWSLIRSSP